MKSGLRIFAVSTLALALAASGVAVQGAEPIKTKSGEIGAAAAGKGQIVFYRPGSIMGAALGCTVHEGDREVARLGSGKYFVITTEVGKHAYFTRGQAADTLNLEVEADETYFVKCKIGSGTISGAAQLEPSDRDSFLKKAKGSSLWKGPAAG
ncbi:MAG: DUF2846 domain-containing protein [Novosphingobium sp.]